MQKTLFALVLGLGLAAGLSATPTRLLTVDNLNQVVPDDWDATTYYSLSPNFQNHWYADVYDDGRNFGWAFLDIKIGTLVIWYNKDFEGNPVFDTAAAKSTIGLNKTAFGTNLVNAVEPREYRLQDPDTKLGLGYAYPLLEDLTLALCFRLAQVDNSNETSVQLGGPSDLGRSTGYSVNGAVLGANFASVTHVSHVKDAQSENAILLSPQFSYNADRFTIDAKFDMFWPTVNNRHDEDVFENATNYGSTTQTLKDRGKMNWFAKPKLRYMLDRESSLVLRASYGKLDLGTDHRVKGDFQGSFGALSNGYEFNDATQDCTLDLIDSFLGYVKTWDKGRDLVTCGVGFNQTTVRALGSTYQLRGGASSYNDVVLASSSDLSDVSWAVPVMLGGELSLTNWAKARAVLQRNFFTNDDSKTVTKTYDDQGVALTQRTSESTTDFGKGWAFNTGFGLSFGSFDWDTALNLGSLASPNGTGMVNPLYQSSFTYAF